MANWYITPSDKDIIHFGILGMKWGIRRYQNKDGSLTFAGRKRYSKEDVRKDLNKSMQIHKEAYGRALKNDGKIQDMANSLSKDIDKEYNSMSLTFNEIKEITNKLIGDFGGTKNDLLKQVDDQDYFDSVLDEYIDEVITNKLTKNPKIKQKWEEFDKLQENYWNDIKKVREYVDKKYSDNNPDPHNYSIGQQYVSDILGETLDLSFNSYISRHFDDYWVNDLDSRYKANDRLRKQFYNSFIK